MGTAGDPLTTPSIQRFDAAFAPRDRARWLDIVARFHNIIRANVCPQLRVATLADCAELALKMADRICRW
jgi:hypothetical protein